MELLWADASSLLFNSFSIPYVLTTQDNDEGVIYEETQALMIGLMVQHTHKNIHVKKKKRRISVEI